MMYFGAFFVLFTFTSLITKCTHTQQQQPPHILFMVIDDLGYTDVSYHGGEYETPNIDNLAKSGVDLSNYYVAPVCTPTRAAFMTGLFPTRIGLQNPETMAQGTKAHIPLSTPTLPELVLRSGLGYNTQMIGKWHLGYARYEHTPNGRGFNDYFGFYGGAQDYYTHLEFGGYDLHINNDTYWSAQGVYTDDLYFDYLTDFLNANYGAKGGEQDIQTPLFMYFASQTVHAPIQAPPVTEDSINACKHINNTFRYTYCLKMVYLDAKIGTLMHLLHDLQMLENTLIIFTTDNGGMPWHDDPPNPIYNFTTSYGSNYPLRGGKVTLFEGGCKGIAFVCGGSAVMPSEKRGTVDNGLYTAMDWLPTILSLLNASELTPAHLDGEDILPYLLYSNETFGRTRVILDANFDAVQPIIAGSLLEGAIIDDGWKYIFGEQLYNCWYPALPAGIICPTWNNSNTNATTKEYLFHLAVDPYERYNVIAEYPARAKYMAGLIVEDAIENGWVYNEMNVVWHYACSQFHNDTWVMWEATEPDDDFPIPACHLL